MPGMDWSIEKAKYRRGGVDRSHVRQPGMGLPQMNSQRNLIDGTKAQPKIEKFYSQILNYIAENKTPISIECAISQFELKTFDGANELYSLSTIRSYCQEKSKTPIAKLFRNIMIENNLQIRSIDNIYYFCIVGEGYQIEIDLQNQKKERRATIFDDIILSIEQNIDKGEIYRFTVQSLKSDFSISSIEKTRELIKILMEKRYVIRVVIDSDKPTVQVGKRKTRIFYSLNTENQSAGRDS